MAGDLLAALAAPLNRRILETLAVEPSYARRIAARVDAAEAEVSRRLRALERLGLLSSKWQRAASNVKVYALRSTSLRVDITSGGLELSLRGPRASAPSPAPAVPLPPVDRLVGRQDALAALGEGDPVVILEGLPGIGKTSLLATHVQGSAALWFTCRGNETLGWFADQVATQLSARGDEELRERLRPDAPGPEVAALVLDRLQRPGTTTVMDDVHRITDPALRGFLDDALASFGNGRLLLGSRERVAHARRAGVRVVELGGLDGAGSVALLAYAGLDVPPHLVGRLQAEAGGHPLALTLLAEAARTEGLERLLDRRPERELTHYLLEEIDAGLSDNERTALAHASVFPHVFGPDDLEALGTRMPEAALTGLRRRRLVSADERGYRLPEVVRNFFYERLQDRARLHRAAAQRRMEKEDVEGHLEAMHHLMAAGDRTDVVKLLSQDVDVHEYRHIDPGLHRVYTEILDGFSRDEVGDACWAQILDERGDLAFHADRWDQALVHYGEAEGLFSLHMPDRCGDVQWKRALCLQQQGRLDEAEKVCRAALPAATGEARSRIVALRGQLETGLVAP